MTFPAPADSFQFRCKEDVCCKVSTAQALVQFILHHRLFVDSPAVDSLASVLFAVRNTLCCAASLYRRKFNLDS